MDSSDLLPGELLLSWQLGPEQLQRDLHQLLVVVSEENFPSVGVDLLVELDQGFPLTGWKINGVNISFGASASAAFVNVGVLASADLASGLEPLTPLPG